ncbi:winged helix-turn-helix domain-containing protein [Streptomyces wuyuanensis]|uniref:winged helix-turn-helix domain-containing protein n=1 Tax=Streptomyces wuyuanensis TaxID=1196353 RepID=UPI003D758278
MTRALVVEDEPPLVRALTINLRARAYEVDAASDGTKLLARLRAAVRRNTPDGAGGALPADEPRSLTVVTEDFTVDLAARKVRRGGQAVRLTPTEWHPLEILVRSPGRLISQRQLLEEVWGPTFVARTNYLRVYTAQLRRKLEKDPSHPRYLITEPGMGYRFEG